jgi:hypothetical protein
MTMLRKFTLGLIAAASLGAMALAPTVASAHSSGHSSGGSSPHLSSGMMGSGKSRMGTRFIGPAVQKNSDRDHRHFHRFGFRYFPVAAYDPCWVTERVPTPIGFRLRRVNVCGY